VTTLDGDNNENLNYTSAIKAAVDWFGPIDFSTMDDQFKASGITSMLGSHSAANSPEGQFIGQALTATPALVQKANPESYISTMKVATAPSFLIQHGSNDNLVPYQQSTTFAEKLKAAIGGIKVTVEVIKGAGHGTQEFSSAPNITKVFNFLDPIMKKAN